MVTDSICLNCCNCQFLLLLQAKNLKASNVCLSGPSGPGARQASEAGQWVALHCIIEVELTLPSFFDFFKDRLSCSPGWPQTHYVAEDGHELTLLLSTLTTIPNQLS